MIPQTKDEVKLTNEFTCKILLIWPINGSRDVIDDLISFMFVGFLNHFSGLIYHQFCLDPRWCFGHSECCQNIRKCHSIDGSSESEISCRFGRRPHEINHQAGTECKILFFNLKFSNRHWLISIYYWQPFCQCRC